MRPRARALLVALTLAIPTPLLATPSVAAIGLGSASAQAGVADPFDTVAGRTAKGDPVYRDTNKDGKIRPDRARARGVGEAMYVTGADEVVLLDSEAAVANSPTVRSTPAVAAADCYPKYGFSAAEAYWWSNTGIKYTFRWEFATQYHLYGCSGQGLGGSRYVAELISKRLTSATPAYLTNNNASWERWDPDSPGPCTGACLDEEASRNWGTTYFSDGQNTYIGTWHDPVFTRWHASESDTLRATFTAPSPDHPTNVYYGCSEAVSSYGEIAPFRTCW